MEIAFEKQEKEYKEKEMQFLIFEERAEQL